jgi:hypothetical protein
MLDLCEIPGRQLDVTRRTVLNGAPDISVYKQKNNLSKVAQCAMRTHELPGMGTTLGPNDVTHAMHSWAAVIPFLAAIASRAETRPRLCLKF